MLKRIQPLLDPNTPPGQGAPAPASAAPPVNAPQLAPQGAPAPAPAPTPSAPAQPTGLPDESTIRSQLAALELTNRFQSIESQNKALEQKLAALEAARAQVTTTPTAPTRQNTTNPEGDDYVDPAVSGIRDLDAKIAKVTDALTSLQKAQDDMARAEQERQHQAAVEARRKSEMDAIPKFFEQRYFNADPELKNDKRLQGLVKRDLDNLMGQIDWTAPDLQPQYLQLQLRVNESVNWHKKNLAQQMANAPDPTLDARTAAQITNDAAQGALNVTGAPAPVVNPASRPNRKPGSKFDFLERLNEAHRRLNS